MLHLIFQDGLKPKDTKIVQDSLIELKYRESIELKYGHFRDAKKFSQEIEKTPNKILDRRNQIQQFLLKGLLFSLSFFFFLFSFFFFFFFNNPIKFSSKSNSSNSKSNSSKTHKSVTFGFPSQGSVAYSKILFFFILSFFSFFLLIFSSFYNH